MAIIDVKELPSQYRCQSFAAGAGSYDTRRQAFLREASTVSAPTTSTLAPVVVSALEQAKRDLAALRLHDFDHGERAWTMAAGLPVYVSLFGRDTLTLADARPRTRGCRKARAATDLPNDKKRMNLSKHLFRADVDRPDPQWRSRLRSGNSLSGFKDLPDCLAPSGVAKLTMR
jgi:hypothetical protein